MARLPQGVIKRKDGTLQKRFTVDGKRYSIYGHTVAELVEKETVKRQEIEKGIFKSNKNVTFDDYFEEFKEQKSKYVKTATVYIYKSVYKACLEPYIGKKRIVNFERRQCLQLQNELIKEKGVDSTNYAIKLLKNMLKNAVEDGIITVNPASNIKLLKDPNKKAAAETIHRALTEQEQKIFVDSLKSHDEFYYEFIAFMLLTGVRYGEAASLSWGDIDFKNNVIHINKTATKDLDGKIKLGTPKTKTSNRDIPMNQNIRDLLKSQKKKCKLVYASIQGIENLVFPSCYGKVTSNKQLNEVIVKHLKLLESEGKHIEHFSTHCFRDTFATRFIEQGGTPQTLKTILGHNSLAMTMDLYAHVLPNTKQAEMDRLNIIV